MRRDYDRVEGGIGRSYDEIKLVSLTDSHQFSFNSHKQRKISFPNLFHFRTSLNQIAVPESKLWCRANKRTHEQGLKVGANALVTHTIC